jgi:hypothetical protein
MNLKAAEASSEPAKQIALSSDGVSVCAKKIPYIRKDEKKSYF